MTPPSPPPYASDPTFPALRRALAVGLHPTPPTVTIRER